MGMPKNYITNIEQLYERAEESESGCLEWIGNKDKDGYGRIKINYVQTPVHRLVAKLVYGEPANGQVALHSCDNPPCILAGHLRWGTYKENAEQREARGRGNNQYTVKKEDFSD